MKWDFFFFFFLTININNKIYMFNVEGESKLLGLGFSSSRVLYGSCTFV